VSLKNTPFLCQNQRFVVIATTTKGEAPEAILSGFLLKVGIHIIFG
jgi:hypothetical protein